MIQSWTELMIPQEIDDLLKFIPIWPNCVKTQRGEIISKKKHSFSFMSLQFLEIFFLWINSINLKKYPVKTLLKWECYFRNYFIETGCYFTNCFKPLWKKSSIKGSYSSTDSLDSYVIQALVLQISYNLFKKVSCIFSSENT